MIRLPMVLISDSADLRDMGQPRLTVLAYAGVVAVGVLAWGLAIWKILEFFGLA